uniref:PROP1-like PPR domain-containing protein n=1 Tax=Kalanchoe fedtschenkoi TaxID=63787 RepID=A0A7N0UA75_KALFE
MSLHFAKDADDVEEVFKDKGELPLQVYSTMIKGFGIDDKFDAAMALMAWLKRKKEEDKGFVTPNLFTYNSLLGAVKQSRRYRMVEEIIDDMAQQGITPSIVTYNIIMAIWAEQGRVSEALGVIEDIREKGLWPSPVTYSTALIAYGQGEDGFGALKFYVDWRERYRRGEIGKDDDGEDWGKEFGKLEKLTIRVCIKVMRRWLLKPENLSTDVLKLFTEMDKAELHPIRPELERLAWACTRDEQHVVAKELYNRIRERYGADISLSVCNHVIWLLGKAKKWWAALEVFEELLDKGPKPNNLSNELIVSHFNVLLTAARKRGIWRWGVRLLNRMEEKGLKPGSREWNAVLIACSKASETSAAVQIFKRMVERGEKPTIVSYGALLSALEKGGLYDEALRVWDHMVKVGVVPNLHAYTIMASICVGQGKFNLVDSVIRDMIASGVQPTVVTYNAVISGCARKGWGSAAYEWFHRMKVHGIAPNEISYEMLIIGLTKDGKPRLAYELFLRAQAENLKLSVKAYDAVVESARASGSPLDLNALGPRPPDKVKITSPVLRKNLTQFCDLADVPKRSEPFDISEIYSPSRT